MRPARIFLVLGLLSPLAVLAQQKPCTAADAAAATKAVDRIVSWATLHKAWTDYRHCDVPGPVEDGFTDAMLRLLVDWKDVNAFAADWAKDAQYKGWIQRHLRTPLAKDDLDSIHNRAKASCPAGLDAFCAELAETVKPAK